MRSVIDLKDRSQQFLLDALRYSLLMEDRSYRAMRAALRRIERHPASKKAGRHPPESMAVAALSEAWQVIDMTHRVRGLAGQIRGLSQRSTEFRRFKAGTSGVEVFRNIFQHLNSNIPKITGQTSPILGTISWVTSDDPMTSLTITFGRGGENCSYHTLAFCPDDWSFAPSFQFTAGNMDIDLSKTNRECRLFSEHLERWLEEQNMLESSQLKVAIIRIHLNAKPPLVTNPPLSTSP